MQPLPVVAVYECALHAQTKDGDIITLVVEDYDGPLTVRVRETLWCSGWVGSRIILAFAYRHSTCDVANVHRIDLAAGLYHLTPVVCERLVATQQVLQAIECACTGRTTVLSCTSSVCRGVVHSTVLDLLTAFCLSDDAVKQALRPILWIGQSLGREMMLGVSDALATVLQWKKGQVWQRLSR